MADESGATTCLTKSQLDALLSGQSSSSGVQSYSSYTEQPTTEEQPTQEGPAPEEETPVVDRSADTTGQATQETTAEEPVPEEIQ